VEIRLCYYLNKRNTAAVIVCKGNSVHIIVNELTCVLLEMDTVDTNYLVLTVHLNVNMTVKADRTRHLGNLISLGQVGIEIILSVPLCKAADITIHNIACLDDILNSASVEHGKCSRKTAAYGTAAGVRLAAKLGRAGAEHLGICQKLSMDLKTHGRKICTHSDTSY